MVVSLPKAAPGFSKVVAEDTARFATTSLPMPVPGIERLLPIICACTSDEHGPG